MRTIPIFLILVILFTACKKENPATQSSFPDKIVLNNLQTSLDSVVLIWSALEHPDFYAYTVIRKESPSDPGVNISNWISGSHETRFVDKYVSYTPYLVYQVVGQLRNGQSIMSNEVSYLRPEIKVIDIKPFDVQFDNQNRKLYFFEKNGIISIYNVQDKQLVKSLNTGSAIGYCDFGTYNGIKELYVPRNDGWIFVYNAQTLEKIDQISVGLASSCIVFSNNMLYVSSAAWTNRPLKVYNRATKSLIAESGDFELTRFKKIPNSNTELIEISINIAPTDQDYYSFGANGNFILHRDDRYHGDYPLNAGIFEFFPSGNKYITSSSGAIYNKDMAFDATLPRGNLEFTSFCFDGQSIFCGTTSKTIEVYSETSYTHLRSIRTKAYPYRLFKDGNNGFICLSSTTFSNYSNPTKITIETIQ
jgi:hypothetical protein